MDNTSRNAGDKKAVPADAPLGFGFARSVMARVEECTWAKLNAAIDSPEVEAVCRQLRGLKERRDAGGLADADYEALKGQLKRRLPVIMPHAAFPSGRRKNPEAVPSGLAMYDADHIGPPHDYWERKVLAACGGQPARLGIVMAHITPSYEGMRLIFRIPAGMTLPEAQQWMARQLGDETYDTSVKDLARCSFLVPRAYWMIMRGEVGSVGGVVLVGEVGGASSSATRTASPPLGEPEGAVGAGGDGAVVAVGAAASSPSFRGIPYQSIISVWWKHNGGMPVEGERNTKLYMLAVNLRHICDNREALLLRVMPRLGLSETELQAIVRSACAAPASRMPRKLVRIVEEARRQYGEDTAADGGGAHKTSGSRSGGSVASDMRRLWLRRLPPLPPGLREATEAVIPRLRMGALLAQLVMIYTLLTRIRFSHFDGTETRLSGITFIIGPAASGKAFIRRLDEMWMEPVRAADAKGRHIEAEYRREKELRKNERKQIERPHPVIRVVPIQISNAMLITRLMDAVDEDPDTLTMEHLHLYSCETELATALRAQRGGTWIEKNDIYCKAFHNEPWGVDYANDQVINGEVEVNYNLVISGTDDAFHAFIPPGTVLSGLPTRLMYFQMDAEPFKMIECDKPMDAEKRELVRSVARRLDKLRGHVDAAPLATAMYKWCEAQAARAQDETDYELDDLRKRTALIGARAGVAFAIMEHLDDFERTGRLTVSAAAVKFARVIADFCLDMQYMKFSVMMRERKDHVSDSWRTAERNMYSSGNLNMLPEHFTCDDLKRLRPDKSDDANRKLVAYWMARGYVKRGKKKGQYVKSEELKVKN